MKRRSFLKSAGVSIALPFISSIPTLNAVERKKGAPKRMVFVCSALGVHPNNFFPRDFGKNFSPSLLLKPVEDLREDLTVFSHMDHPSIFNGHDSKRSLLSGISLKGTKGEGLISVDQLAAEHVGYDTRFPSMHISINGSQDASWTRSGTKVREEASPRSLFNKLFVNNSAAANKNLEKELSRQGSVLDLVKGQAKKLSKNISSEDRDKLDEYLTAIRNAEQRIQGVNKWKDTPKPKVEFNQPPNVSNRKGNESYTTLVPMMFDLIYLAIQSDSSRVFTAGFGYADRVLNLDGVTKGAHSLSHHGKLKENLRQLEIIDTFHMEQYARFLQKLKDTKGSAGNLLDDTMVFFGSGLGDAAKHSNRDLPIILAGGGLKHQGHFSAKQPSGKSTPLNNLYTSMIQNFGVEKEKFNRSTGNIGVLHS